LITFDNGGELGIFSADNEDSIRSNAFHLVVIDEAAKVSEAAWTDAIQPTLSDYSGDAILISTPRGMNWFYKEWLSASDDGKYAAAFKAPTNSNPMPTIKAAFDKIKQRADAGQYPDRSFRQEWLAEFLADGSYFQNIDAAAIIEQPDTPDQHRGHTIVFGVDWGKSNDWTVITVACRQCNRVVDWQRFNQIDYHIQRGRLAQMVNDWHPLAVLPERNSIGAVLIDELERDGIPIMAGSDGAAGFNTTATSKADIIESLHMALVRDGFTVPTDYGDELRAYEIEIRAGAPKFGAPSGLHDDRVMSLALAWRAAIEASPAIIGW
jgi:hypothetical protein